MPTRLEFKKWDTEFLGKRAEKVLEKVGPVFAEEATRQMANPIWDWAWATLRFESLLMGGATEPGLPGVVVSPGPRDIVDTGNLMDSMTKPKVIREPNKVSLVISWGGSKAPYAQRVLKGGVYGGYINPRGQFVSVGDRPARNWIQAALEAKPAAQVFADIWRSGAA